MTSICSPLGLFRSEGGEDRVVIARVKGTVRPPSIKDFRDLSLYDISIKSVDGGKRVEYRALAVPQGIKTRCRWEGGSPALTPLISEVDK